MEKRGQGWWRNAVIYQVYPRSFQDTDGDGEGDLRGVIKRLPYLRWLGVDAIWLSPFYESPNKDGGYDVSDPREVDPRFGNLATAEELIDQTHNLGLKIIVDIVPNHFSTDHIWFNEAVTSPKNSEARKRFHFYDGRGKKGEIPPNNWNSIFGGPAWTRLNDEADAQWYLHLFDSTQADLNWQNDEVRSDFEKTLKFWLDLGVDGFRIDVAHGLAKDEILKDHPNPEGLTRALRLDVTDMPESERAALLSDVPFFDREGVHEIYRNWRELFDSYPGERIAVAEAWVHPSSRAARYVRSDELHQIFNFDFLIAPWDGEYLVSAIKRTLSEVGTVGAPATWVLSNHDSPRLVSRLGGGEIGQRRARAFALLTHALPGGCYIYQGEELGLSDGVIPDSARQDPVYFRTNGEDKGRDGARVPIPWSNDVNYGFTRGNPWLPMAFNSSEAVESQMQNRESSLNLYHASIEIRNSHPALKKSSNQEIGWLETQPGVIAFKREPGLIVFANTTNRDLLIPLDLPAKLLIGSNPEVKVKGTELYLAKDSTCWLEV